MTQVTSYEGYKKESFLELPNIDKASSAKQHSTNSSADEEQVKQDAKSSYKKNSSKKS